LVGRDPWGYGTAIILHLSLFQPARSPLHASTGARALRVKLQCFARIRQRLLRVRVRGSQDQPGILHVRSAQRSLFSQLPRGRTVPAAQGFTRFADELTSFDEMIIHKLAFNNKNKVVSQKQDELQANLPTTKT
jgi:hypothetical protein